MGGNILIVSGLGDSEKDHGQTHWEKDLLNCSRVVQHDWEQPAASYWLATLCEVVERSNPHILLVAHSLGCSLVAYFEAKPLAKKVIGLFW